MPLDPAFEKLSYFGFGPYECYVDFKAHAHLGWWESTVKEEYTDYLRPQECGNHIGVEHFSLSDGKKTITVRADDAIEFSALPYGIEELTLAEHPYELPAPSATECLICYRNNGIGTGSCGAPLSEKYRFRDLKFSYSFLLSFES